MPDLWLQRIRGTRFLYPSSGADHAEALELFSPFLDRFMFADILRGYGARVRPKPENVIPSVSHSVVQNGDCMAAIGRRRIDGRQRCHLDPAHTIRTYVRRNDQREIEVCWRRGFGQFAIHEQPVGQLGVFMHRGDSGGESGSGIHYFGDLVRSYPPLSRLWSHIESKLAPYSLAISDGSNSCFEHLRISYRDARSSQDAFAQYAGTVARTDNHDWELVGYLKRRNGPTFVWGLTRR